MMSSQRRRGKKECMVLSSALIRAPGLGASSLGCPCGDTIMLALPILVASSSPAATPLTTWVVRDRLTTSSATILPSNVGPRCQRCPLNEHATQQSVSKAGSMLVVAGLLPRSIPSNTLTFPSTLGFRSLCGTGLKLSKHAWHPQVVRGSCTY